MKVGIPAEISPTELRVAATPKTVKRLQKQGFEVYIQHNAGTKANFSDKEFEEAGAKIVSTAAEIYGQSDIVLKVKEPSMAKDDPERQARLAEALRANLRRRKAQGREQQAERPAQDSVGDPKAAPSRP